MDHEVMKLLLLELGNALPSGLVLWVVVAGSQTLLDVRRHLRGVVHSFKQRDYNLCVDTEFEA